MLQACMRDYKSEVEKKKLNNDCAFMQIRCERKTLGITCRLSPTERQRFKTGAWGWLTENSHDTVGSAVFDAAVKVCFLLADKNWMRQPWGAHQRTI